MKKWRKNNAHVTASLQQIDADLHWYQRMHKLTGGYEKEVKKLEARRNAVAFSRLTRKEARTHFAAEVATPSQTLLTLLWAAGFKVPEEFANQIGSYYAQKFNEQQAKSQATPAIA